MGRDRPDGGRMIMGIVAGQMMGAGVPGGGAHEYWRINGSSPTGVTFLAIAEVEMRATLGGADQCAGGTPSASTADPSSPASNAFDNNATTRWSTVSGNTTGWLLYRFAAPVGVLEYTIQAHPTAPVRSPKDFSLEFSDDGVDWTAADTRTNQIDWGAGEIRTYQV